MHEIRQRLLTENRFTRYLLYAIVEILIVIIGILIAIELDNWNEARKSRIQEIEIYKEIRSDLLSSRRELHLGMKHHLRKLYSTIMLRDQLKTGKAVNRVHDNIDNDYQFFPVSSGFEALKSVGLETLTNDNLRQTIVNLYQLEFQRVVALGRDNSNTMNFEFLTPLIMKYIDLSDSELYFYSPVLTEKDGNAPLPDSIMVHEIKLINFDEMQQDRELLLSIEDAIKLRQLKAEGYQLVIGRVSEVIESIDSELELLEKY